MAVIFSALMGDPHHDRSAIWQAVQRAREAAPQIPPEARDSFVLLLHLHIPGSILSDLGWSGIRTSSSSKEEKWAAIQAAVPLDVVNSSDAPRWLVNTLRDAIALCERKCKRQKYPFDRQLHEDSLKKIEDALRVRAT